MARGRQRRKQRRREEANEAPGEASIAEDHGGVAEELQGEAEGIEFTLSPFNGQQGWKAERGGKQAVALTKERAASTLELMEEADRTHAYQRTGQVWPQGSPERERIEAEAEDAEPEPTASDVIAVIGPLRNSRQEHPLAAGIRMFTAMLDEARGGYIVDRIAEYEEAIGEPFNELERDGIIQIASSELDQFGVPDVDMPIRLALQARAEVAVTADDPPVPPTEEEIQREGMEISEEEAQRLEEAEAQQLEEAEEEEAARVREEEDFATRESAEEPEDPDAPGPDEQ